MAAAGLPGGGGVLLVLYAYVHSARDRSLEGPHGACICSMHLPRASACICSEARRPTGHSLRGTHAVSIHACGGYRTGVKIHSACLLMQLHAQGACLAQPMRNGPLSSPHSPARPIAWGPRLHKQPSYEFTEIRAQVASRKYAGALPSECKAGRPTARPSESQKGRGGGGRGEPCIARCSALCCIFSGRICCAAWTWSPCLMAWHGIPTDAGRLTRAYMPPRRASTALRRRCVVSSCLHACRHTGCLVMHPSGAVHNPCTGLLRAPVPGMGKSPPGTSPPSLGLAHPMPRPVIADARPATAWHACITDTTEGRGQRPLKLEEYRGYMAC